MNTKKSTGQSAKKNTDSGKRKVLGRGLSVLLPDTGDHAEGQRGGMIEVPIEKIKPVEQPRKAFPEKGILELADSIKRQGVLQPLLVRKAGDGYFLIAGERRWRAAKTAGLKTVPVVIKDAEESRAFELALVENLQRQDLNPIEEAEAYRRLIQDYGHTQETVAKSVGKDRSTVTNELRLLKLPESVKSMVARDELSSGHARALLALNDSAMILALAKKTVEEGLSVRSVEHLVRKAVGNSDAKKDGGSTDRDVRSAAVRDLEERLQRSLGARVLLKDRGRGRGRIEISYSNLDELDRLLDFLLK